MLRMLLMLIALELLERTYCPRSMTGKSTTDYTFKCSSQAVTLAAKSSVRIASDTVQVTLKKVANGDIWFFTERDWSQGCCHGNNLVGAILFLL